MPRGRKAGTGTETLAQQIEKAQQKVIKTRQTYESAVDALQKLLDKRDAQRKEELWNAIIKSEKSYDEILSFIIDGEKTEDLSDSCKKQILISLSTIMNHIAISFLHLKMQLYKASFRQFNRNRLICKIAIEADCSVNCQITSFSENEASVPKKLTGNLPIIRKKEVNIMKKSLVYLLSACLLAGTFTGCSTENKPETTTEAKAEITTEAVTEAATEAVTESATEAATELATTEANTEATGEPSEETGTDEPASANAEYYDALFNAVLEMQNDPGSIFLFKSEDREYINAIYPGLSEVGLRDVVLYEPPISGYACEIIIGEAENADEAAKLAQVYQDRIDSMVNGGGCDADLAEVWKSNAKVTSKDNYVAMVVLPTDSVLPDDIFTLQ